MTDEQKAKLERLELNKETIQDLTELEAEVAQGGLGHLDPSGHLYCSDDSNSGVPQAGVRLG
jgi:hypothetical protein